MTSLRSPNSSTNVPPPKKGVFSSSSSRRPSTSTGSTPTSGALQLPQGIGYSPGSATTYYTTPSSPAGPGSGIPAFRSLRSLLPFGPGSSNSSKNNVSQTSSPSNASTPNSSGASRSPFSGFGSVRKSMTRDRERKTSLSNDALVASPVIAIERQSEDAAIRRSASLSRIEKPLPREPDFEGFSNSPFRQDSSGSSSRNNFTLGSEFTLRTPSPGPPLSAELSTIIEADSSGVSKHFPEPATAPTRSQPHSRSSSPHIPSRRPSPSPRDFLHPLRKASGGSHIPVQVQQPQAKVPSADLDPDTSNLLNLSASEVASQVRDALRKSTSSSQSGQPSWREVDKAVVIDADEHPEVAEAVDNIGNATLNFDAVDPDLLALLSPNNAKTASQDGSPQHSTGKPSIRPQPSPTTPTFPTSTSRLPKARQSSSFIPRTSASLASHSHSRSPSASPSTPQFSVPSLTPTTPRPSTSPEKSSAPVIAVNGDLDAIPTSPSSPPASPPSTVTSTPAAPRRTFTLSRSTGSGSAATRLFSPPSLSLSSSGSTSRVNETSPEGGNSSTSPNLLSNSTSTSTPASNSKPPRVSTRTLRQVMLSVSTSRSRGKEAVAASPPSPNALSFPHRGSLDSRRPLSRSAGAGLGSEIGLGRPSLDLDRRRPGRENEARLKPDGSTSGFFGSSSKSWSRTGSSSPERSNTNTRSETSPVTTPATEVESPDMQSEEPSFFAQARARPSFDSTARPSLDTGYTGSRPGSVARLRDWDRERERDRERTPSLRVTDLAGENTSVISASSPPNGSVSGSVASAPLTARSPASSTSPSSSARPGVLARMRKRSMSVQERLISPRSGGSGAGRLAGIAASESGGVSRPGSSLSVHGGGGRGGRAAGFGLEGYASQEGGGGPGSGGGGPKVELLGPRTVKAFRAAGLLDFERDRDREASVGAGASSSVLAPSPLSGGASSALSRFGSLRSASEYTPGHHSNGHAHTRALSRMAFSEAGGPASESGRLAGGSYGGRRGSGTFSAYGGGSHGQGLGHSHSHHSNGLMESPTFTASSGSRDRERGERDTPKSTPSTAPTSVSESFGYLGRARDLDSRERDRDRERDEIAALKEKHLSDMNALLSALADSQRTTKMLREENSDLRERLDEALAVIERGERDVKDMRRVLDSIERENEGLRREVSELRVGRFRDRGSERDRERDRGMRAPPLTHTWSGSSASSGLRTPVGRQVNGSPLAMDSTPKFLRRQDDDRDGDEQEGEEVFDNTILIHDSIDDDRDERRHHGGGSHDVDEVDDDELDLNQLTTSTPSTKRRMSNTSSIFPMPPANMTMLLHEHEDSALHLGGSQRSSADHEHSQFSFASTTATATANANYSNSKPKSTSIPIAAPQPISRTPPVSYRTIERSEPGHMLNKSVASTMSISPTTANFSIVTGSPGSLMLRPEHELLLGDMESLDLGVRPGKEELEAMMNLGGGAGDEDVW